MRRKITRFSPHQTAKVIALLYLPLGVLTALVLGLAPASPGTEKQQLPLVFIILLPFIYSFVCYLFIAIGCWMYNICARWVGGIEVEVDDAPDT